MIRRLRVSHIASVTVALLLAGCLDGDSSESARDAANRFDESFVLATIDDEVITAREFRLNYELGFPHLKSGDNPAEVYLRRMIDEKLLAAEGRRLGLDTTARVRRRVRNLREQIAVEEVFRKHVNERVRVTDDEIEELRRRDHVRFRLRYLPASTTEAADRLGDLFESHGFLTAVTAVNELSEGLNLPPEAFETGYLSHADVEPHVLAAVSDLEPGGIAGPIRLGGSHLIVQLVDIRREPMTQEPTPAERERYRQIVFQRTADSLAGEFVRTMMEPSAMRLRASVLGELETRLWTWLNTRGAFGAGGGLPAGEQGVRVARAPTHVPDPASTLLEQIERSSDDDARPLRELYDEVVMTTVDADWTVRRFLDEYPHARYPLSLASRELFRSSLYDAFGLTLRDRTFIKLAREEDLLRSDSLQRIVKLWEDKWVYEAFRDAVRDSLIVSDGQVAAYFERHRQFWPGRKTLADVRAAVDAHAREAMMTERVRRRLDELRASTEVHVDRTVLDSIDLSPPDAAPVAVVALHTGRPAYPVVDPSM